MTDLFARKTNARSRARNVSQTFEGKAVPNKTVSSRAVASRVAKGARHTLPILLVGSIAMSLNLTSPIDTTNLKRDDKPKDSNEQLRNAVAIAMNAAAQERAQSGTPATASSENIVVAATVPSSYRVASGDTVSSIAARHGLSTASVLALNGLGWKSLIFPGQVLQLKNSSSTPQTATPPAATPPSAPSQVDYTITRGDTISAIASRFGVTTQALLAANRLGWSTIIYPGQKIVIPGKASPSTPPTTVKLTPVSDVTPSEQPPAPAPKSTAPQTKSYVIKTGDNITSIAARFGISVQATLDANGLNRSSIIYAGRTLTIPAVSNTPTGVGSSVTPLTSEMATNARTIISVGTSLGVNEYGLVIALSAAMQESTLRNLNYGDRDSLGLFQQRPSTGWGTPSQVTDPVYSSKLFFGGPSNPNTGNTQGLLDIPGWQSMTVTQAAQAVQISGYPDAYAKWETSARAWLIQLG